MILLVDIGNSRIKSACWQRGGLSEQHAVASDGGLDEAWGGTPTPERVIACNVAGPAAARRLAGWCARRRVALQWLTSMDPIDGLTHGYPQPATLGDDRWLALAGARRNYGGALCVIDCGTATTVDVVDARGVHRGGAILPGVATMRIALQRRARHLPCGGASDGAFATDTDSAVAGGTTYALCGAVERLLREARAQFGPRLRCILGGGEAALVSPLMRQKHTLDGTLVLTGLAVAAGLR